MSIFEKTYTFTDNYSLDYILMPSSIKKALPVTVTAVVLWAVLAFIQKPFLLKTNDLSLFLFDWNFLKESFMIPGGFLGWAGSFFTQFMYLPWLGSLLWVSLLWLSYLLTIRIFRIPSELTALAAIPAAILVIANMSLGYGIFIMRSQDYFFAPTLGYLLILGITWAVANSPKVWEKIVILTIAAFAGYILAGIFALTGVLTAGICVLTSDREKALPASGGIISCIVSAALCIAAPLLLYGLFTRYRLADSWDMGLPAISDDEWTDGMRLPYRILLGLSVVFASVCGLWRKIAPKRGIKAIANPIIAVILIATTVLLWHKDANFKAELKMSIAADQSDWKQVVEIYRKATTKNFNREKKTLDKRKDALDIAAGHIDANLTIDKFDENIYQPTRLMVLFRDLALLKQGRALDAAFTMRDGGKGQNTPHIIPMAFQAARQLYLNYGVVNLAYRWCLEDQVEHGWCFGTLKYMATYATLLNETEFAAKYFDKLDRTLFYRKWSRKHRSLSEDAGEMSKSMPYREILPYMSFSDRMSNDHVKCETYLMQHFAEDRDILASPEFDRAALLWAMRTQDISLFWKALAQYLETSADKTIPHNVQEAIYLYSTLENEDMGIPIDKSVKDSYAMFIRYLQQAGFQSEKEARFPMLMKFGNTFYYYYYFVRGLQTF